MSKKIEFVLIDIKCSFCEHTLSPSERHDCEHEKMLPVCAICMPHYKNKINELEPLWTQMSF